MANSQPFSRPTDLPSWATLTAHAQQLKTRHIKELFAEDDGRFNKLSIELPTFCLITPKT